jgi:hypothetical protein
VSHDGSLVNWEGCGRWKRWRNRQYRHLLGRTVDIHEVRQVPSVSAEIGCEHVLDTNVERYRYTNMLGPCGLLGSGCHYTNALVLV